MSLTRQELRANQVLEPTGRTLPSRLPAEPLLILGPQRRGEVAVMGIGDKRRHPRWVAVGLLSSLVDNGAFTVKDHALPASVLRPTAALGPGQLARANERLVAVGPLIHGSDSELLDDPDEFRRLCAAHAKKYGLNVDYVCELIWLWLKNGRVDAAFVRNEDKCGAPGKQRSFKKVVGGPKQRDGKQFDNQAASPYTLEQRVRLVELAERVHKNKRYGIKTKEEKWAALRRMCAKVGLPLPSFAQFDWALKALKERARAHQTVGLLHQRYRGIRYATQEAETDSTQIQAFTDSELAADVKLRNPTWYKCIDVATEYIPGVYLTYSGPSSHCLSELLFVSFTGLAEVAARLGLPYTQEDFPPLYPTRYLWADNQELLARKLNHGLNRHLNMKVKLTIVGQGDDKGMVEGSIGQSKRTLRRRPGFITKHASSKLVAIARKNSVGTRDELLAELIELIWEENHRELPANRLPAAFVATGRPLNRKELYVWSIREYPELIKPIPPREALAKLLLPVDSYRVHAGKGIYVEGRYYTSTELIASGLLKAQAHGKAPQVEVAFHRGTAAFVYWLRTPDDYVKCPLVALDNAVYGNMTVDEAKMHDESMPSSRKRQRQRLINNGAHQGRAKTREDRKKVRDATDKREVTKDKNRIAGVRRLEKNRQDKNDAQNRYGTPDIASSESLSHLQERATDVATGFDDLMAQRLERLMQERLRNQGDPK